jgi:hypothetical protein
MTRSAVIVVTLAIVLAACGSSSPQSSSTSTAGAVPTVPTNTPQVARARLEAAQCFRAHGINIPDFTPGGGRIRQAEQIIASYPTAKVQSVAEACGSYLRQAFPNLTGADLSPTQLAERQHEALAFSECMRSHGIAFPDPPVAGGDATPYLRALGALGTGSPALKSAATTCKAQALKGG